MRLPGQRFKGSLPLFCVIAALLLGISVFLFVSAEGRDREYRYLASLTPTPSAVPRKVSYRYDHATPEPTRLRLGTGAMGQAVYEIQARLKALGYYPYEPDAKFGAGTRDAVLAFQRENGLADDGIVGEDTYRLLMSDAARPRPAER